MFDSKSARRERGQSMVELALSLTAMLFIIVGVLDLGRMYMTYVALQNAAGEGALYAAIHPTWVDSCPSGTFGCNTSAYDNIYARVQHEAPEGTLIDWNSPDFSIDPPSLPGGN